MKYIGAVFVIAGCGGCGFMMAVHHLKQIRLYKKFLMLLDYMSCELQYRATPLPQLCREASAQTAGILSEIFINLADELDSQILPNAYRCMSSALAKMHLVDGSFAQLLLEFSQNLGAFDVTGQLRGFEYAKKACHEKLDSLLRNKDTRLRSYRTLGLCAGATLAILLV